MHYLSRTVLALSLLILLTGCIPEPKPEPIDIIPELPAGSGSETMAPSSISASGSEIIGLPGYDPQNDIDWQNETLR